ncbi:MAG TPA: hypothetical protein VG477_13470 [Thermoanaerobaculia bacterium]|nr:hypothetical protein [Thermoanaerobaculia bacterium]
MRGDGLYATVSPNVEKKRKLHHEGWMRHYRRHPRAKESTRRSDALTRAGSE